MKAVFNSWGPGKYDPRFNIDGLNKPAVIPPAYGLAGIHSITFTGDGDEVAYWNRYVAVTQMGGLGTFTEPRLSLSITNGTEDRVTTKLPALQAYQLSLAAPPPPAGSFDARRGSARQARCSKARARARPATAARRFTDANSSAAPAGRFDGRARDAELRGALATKLYRTTPLRGVWQHAPYFHDGSAATLDDVVAIYNAKRSLGLSSAQISDLVQYLRSL